MELDPQQRAVEARLTALLDRPARRRRWGVGRGGAPAGPGGAYLWGGPGRGKTTLLDRLAAGADVPVVRVHFLDFLIELNRRIGAALVAGGAREPGGAVREAVAAIVGPARLLCFDEFHLHDGADARYLTDALRLLLDRGVLFVATSNYRPADLLPNPLTHELALPVIELIERRLAVIELAGTVDHRSAGRHPGAVAGPDEPAPGEGWPPAAGERPFAELCATPRSPAELRELVARAGEDGLRIGAVPALDAADPEAARRFADLMDLAFDAGMPVWIGSTVPVADLLASTAAVRDGDRLRSRLGSLRVPEARIGGADLPRPACREPSACPGDS